MIGGVMGILAGFKLGNELLRPCVCFEFFLRFSSCNGSNVGDVGSDCYWSDCRTGPCVHDLQLQQRKHLFVCSVDLVQSTSDESIDCCPVCSSCSGTLGKKTSTKENKESF